MRRIWLGLRSLSCSLPLVAALSCSAGGSTSTFHSDAGAGGSGGLGFDAATSLCGSCQAGAYVACDSEGQPTSTTPCSSDQVCVPGLGCALCQPNATTCVANEVRRCAPDGSSQDELVESCDVGAGYTCSFGACKTGCDVATDQPSNVGCEFWAVDLDQQDGLGNDPASMPWGVVLSNAGQTAANVTIEMNTAAVGKPIAPGPVKQLTIAQGQLAQVILPTRELDCGTKPNDYASPGTCLSSRAFRIVSSAPIVVYQFNVFVNAYSNDASLLLPTNALGRVHRVIGWGAGHPINVGFPGVGVDRSYVTVVGTTPGTHVTVKPTWRIKGNPPIATTNAGGTIQAVLGPFDVLNLETDDATFQESQDPMVTDLSGTSVESDQPVAVFSGVESTGAPGMFTVPTGPNWGDGNTCCLDHLEDQMFPMESLGKNYLLTRSPIRSTGSWAEPDVLRFVGAAETATVTTNLPAPYNSFTLQPGEVKTTWAQDDVTVESSAPVLVGQILVSNQLVDGPAIGDPSLTVYPPVEQFREHYLFLTPGSWAQNWVVIGAEIGSSVDVDGSSSVANCLVTDAGTVAGKHYESRRCQIGEGVHRIDGDKPFGIVAYGYGSAGSYAFAGGADVRRIYAPPPLK